MPTFLSKMCHCLVSRAQTAVVHSNLQSMVILEVRPFHNSLALFMSQFQLLQPLVTGFREVMITYHRPIWILRKSFCSSRLRYGLCGTWIIKVINDSPRPFNGGGIISSSFAPFFYMRLNYIVQALQKQLQLLQETHIEGNMSSGPTASGDSKGKAAVSSSIPVSDTGSSC